MCSREGTERSPARWAFGRTGLGGVASAARKEQIEGGGRTHGERRYRALPGTLNSHRLMESFVVTHEKPRENEMHTRDQESWQGAARPR